MNDKEDIIILIIRFIVGSIIGGLLSLAIIFIIETPIWPSLIIGGIITLVAAVSTTIWGDKFLIGFMKIFKIFKYF
jgi:uncharacterized membrane protein YoaK (UPF0700 family)